MCQVELMKLHVICKTPNSLIKLNIEWGRKGQIEICSDCWAKIGNKNWECGKDPRPTFESLFSEKARVGENPILTEYKPKEKELKEQLTEDDEYE